MMTGDYYDGQDLKGQLITYDWRWKHMTKTSANAERGLDGLEKDAILLIAL